MAFAAALIVALGLAAVRPALGEGVGGALTLEDLQTELRQRDALIGELLRRIEKLERQGEVAATQPPPPPAPRPRLTLAPITIRPAQAPAEAEDTTPAGAESAPETSAPAPGQFEVDEEAADRALERTLVQAGALLLPFGRAEFSPSFAYTRRVVDLPTFVTEGGATFVGQDEVRRNEFLGLAGLRVGLPFDSQLELALPYRVVNESRVTKVGDSPRRDVENTGHGFGDVSIGLAKTLLRERGWRPDVIGRLRWDSATGNTVDNDVALGGGFHEFSGSLTFTKRQDPLVFTGRVGYERTLENDDIEPGDALSFSLGTVLAASPETSLRLVLDQTFVDDLRIDGEGINGSDRVISTLNIGAAAVLGRNLLLDASLAVGLTDDSPDYSIRISLPIRFGVPGL